MPKKPLSEAKKKALAALHKKNLEKLQETARIVRNAKKEDPRKKAEELRAQVNADLKEINIPKFSGMVIDPLLELSMEDNELANLHEMESQRRAAATVRLTTIVDAEKANILKQLNQGIKPEPDKEMLKKLGLTEWFDIQLGEYENVFRFMNSKLGKSFLDDDD